MDTPLPTAFRNGVVSAANFAQRLRTIGGQHAPLEYPQMPPDSTRAKKAWKWWRDALEKEISLAVERDNEYFARRMIVVEGGKEPMYPTPWEHGIHKHVLWYVMSQEVERIVCKMREAKPTWTLKRIFLELSRVDPPPQSKSSTEAEGQDLSAAQTFHDPDSFNTLIAEKGATVLALAVTHFMGPAITTSAGVQELSLTLHPIYEVVRDDWGKLLQGDNRICAWSIWLCQCWWRIEKIPGFRAAADPLRLKALQAATADLKATMEERSHSRKGKDEPAEITDVLPLPEEVSKAFHLHLNPQAAGYFNHGRVWTLSLRRTHYPLTERKRSIYRLLY